MMEKILETTIWLSPLGDCDACAEPFGAVMYDANLGGPWGNVCQRCFTAYGCTLGTGRGQRYELLPFGDDKAWIKTGG